MDDKEIAKDILVSLIEKGHLSFDDYNLRVNKSSCEQINQCIINETARAYKLIYKLITNSD
ncbi:MAG: hypothetical protein H6Q73_206 [Firmicutes bacterium]|nr:hypothetical protein [Bacillota bacterium]